MDAEPARAMPGTPTYFADEVAFPLLNSRMLRLMQALESLAEATKPRFKSLELGPNPWRLKPAVIIVMVSHRKTMSRIIPPKVSLQALCGEVGRQVGTLSKLCPG